MPQYRNHPVHRLPTILLQQGPILRMDGHDKAALRPCLGDHDIHMGPRQGASEWR
jgi:hypothetical protein